MAGAPKGNDNAKRGMECRQALKRALARHSKSDFRAGLDLVMDKYVEAASGGDLTAMRDMIDRLDGKPVQAMEVGGPGGEPIMPQINYIPLCKPKSKK